ncbi:transcriptional regulator [Bacillaceae bacterium JMAK1]|nr:transcriptional regulator [Bacillaceae bacterium JMAK1]
MSLPIEINEERQEPIYHQIEEQIMTLIVSEHLLAETALPSIRALASQLGCSVITTRRAYQNLEQRGYIKTVRGKGTFVQQIDTKEKSTQKFKTVHNAAKRAVQIAKQHEYTEHEVKELFLTLIKEEYDA